MAEKWMSVHEVARLTGITARTLHYYDAIGLLKPAKVTDAGYRMYDGPALVRLQNILLFRELEFPLKDIKMILDSPDFDASEVIAQQIKLLELQYKHIGELIAATREIQKNGGKIMNFDVFDKSEQEQYEAEVKEKWGKTKAYQEYKQKEAARKKEHDHKLADELMTLFSELGAFRHFAPDAEEVQKKIAALQKFITDHYYTCTDEILSGLGEMYVCDERFKSNIDKAGGDGTAEFVKQAIAVYCGKKKV